MIISYHSVCGRVPMVIGGYSISIEMFQQQLLHVLNTGRKFASFDEPYNKKNVYITGDDGTIDWCKNVLPLCEKLHIPTHTALTTGVWRGIYPLTHRVQILLAIKEDLPELPLTNEEKAYIDSVYAYETNPKRRYFKGACNLVYDHDRVLEILGEPSDAEKKLLDIRFAKPEDYMGFEYARFGAHTVTHKAYDGTSDYINNEVIASRDDIISAGLKCSDIFTMPMNPKHGVTAEQAKLELVCAGFKGMIHGYGIWNGEDYIMPRIDAKEAFIDEEHGN